MKLIGLDLSAKCFENGGNETDGIDLSKFRSSTFKMCVWLGAIAKDGKCLGENGGVGHPCRAIACRTLNAVRSSGC